ncbi:MAG: protein BatD, partial [Proteobacteria bacterium]|nr:protein BatD [Pseudomonadota bacterium]
MRRFQAEHKATNGVYRLVFGSAIGLAALLLLCSFASEAIAQGTGTPEISMRVDRDPIVQGEPFTLLINIETSSRSEPEIRLPHFSGFRILRQSESHPMSLSFSFGLGKGSQSHMQRQAQYTFVMVADKPGKHQLVPVQVTVDGQKYRGKPYTIHVRRSAAAAPSADPIGGETHTGDDSSDRLVLEGATLDGAKVDPDLFIQTHVSKKKLVVGEPLVMTIYLYTSMNIAEVNVLREPGTEGFWGENLVSAGRRFSREQVRVGEHYFDRAVLRKMALFPIKTGTLTIAPPIVEMGISRGGFFSRPKKVKRSSLPVEVEVGELPKENQPPGFNPANVGVYTFRTQVDTNEVKV